jgi:hypothetical protein
VLSVSRWLLFLPKSLTTETQRAQRKPVHDFYGKPITRKQEAP